jgi:hypothetical protein
MTNPKSAPDRLCWFCGRFDRSISAQGNAIGNMVYNCCCSVSLDVIVAPGESTADLPQRVWDHLLKDRLLICSDCAARLATEVGELPKSYVDAHEARQELQLYDVADLDTCLKPWNEVVYPFGCWYLNFPDIDVNRKFYALDLGELYVRGLRLSGVVAFGTAEFNWCLERFATGTSTATPAFLHHIGEHLIVEGGLPEEVAKVQAVVYDVSIWLNAQNRSQNDLTL